MIALPLRRRAAGLTLIELMVALAIGSLLMIGAVTVFVQSRATFRVSDSVARLQENGRYVLDRLEPDVRMAGYFGLTSRAGSIKGRASSSAPAGIGPQDCETNWAINLESPLEASDDGYPWDCDANGTAVATSDTFVVRRVSEEALTGGLTADTLYVQSGRAVDGQIFEGTTVPALLGTSETHRLIVNGYYVSDTSALSTDANDVPSLRVMTLVAGGDVEDDEVLPGVEDMQVQLGVDVDNFGDPGRGSIDLYVDPGAGILDPGDADYVPWAQVVAVRVWLRIRAELPETGYSDTATYVYADQNVGPFNDAFRRIVVSKTIFLRNTRTII
jgi:type IV pilus assembly protein PilW